jgi:large subunit ribosomal protein L10
MLKGEKGQVVAELTERLKAAESLIVADYRGLTNAELAGLRGALRQHGARFTVVKNTLTRRAAEAAGADQLLALLEGPTAIAFVEADGDPVAVAKALADAAKDTKILTIRGGVLSGRAITEADVDALAALPPADVLKGQVIGAILAPLSQLQGLLNAPLRNLVGLIDARIEQLREQGDGGVAEPVAVEEPPTAAGAAAEPAEAEVTPAAEVAADEPAAGAATEEPVAEVAADEPAAEQADETMPAEGADDTNDA